MTSTPRAVRPMRRLPKAAEVLAAELRGQILAQSLETGTQLTTESELIEGHGFSRGTVREALRLLETEGLITIQRGPRGGVRVARPDLSQVSRTLSLLFTLDQTPLEDFFQFRKIVEPQAARLAATSDDADVRYRLLAYVKQGQEDPERATHFHRELAECTGNEILRVMLVALHEVLDRHVRLETIDEREVSAVAKAHLRIAQAVADGDPDRAEEVMRKHLDAFEKLLSGQGRLQEPIVPRSRWRD
ncbi:hypothetical protein CFI00_17125 [Nocardioides sp. S5]|uniref:FadR/GntR family transcriptional regulator n=1 Tax=Nocardioides sp. S5 TaxID=2017486 RepID=UPI001A8C18FA|nr:FCD domain-containing protein [Nocardioides sp. S5]QSR32190.1 hypothetical protein CFI00_17125 [Nocardioides sp. S5]